MQGIAAKMSEHRGGESLHEMRRVVYTYVYISARGVDMAIARVFRSGNSQAVRLPKEFRVKSTEMEIFRRGDEIVLREKAKGLARAFEILAGLPDDVLPDDRRDTPPQKREGI